MASSMQLIFSTLSTHEQTFLLETGLTQINQKSLKTLTPVNDPCCTKTIAHWIQLDIEGEREQL